MKLELKTKIRKIESDIEYYKRKMMFYADEKEYKECENMIAILKEELRKYK